MPVRYSLRLLVLLTVLGWVGCASVPQRSAFLAEADHVTASEPELRVLLYDFVFEFSTTVGRAADVIGASAPGDLERYRRALIWKLSAGAEARRAAFQPDVLIGFMDIWALAAQQRQFFESGAGRDFFGDQQQIAIEAATDLEAQAQKRAALAADKKGVESGEKMVADWVRDNPIAGPDFRRRSIAISLVERFRPATSRSIPQSVANMEDSLEDVMQRLTIFTEQAPREVLWQSGLLAHEMLEHPKVAGLFEDVTQSREAVIRMTEFTDQLPGLLDEQRRLAFEDIQLEREALIAALQAERVILLEALVRERMAVMEDANRMYAGGLSALREERKAAMAGLPAVAAESFTASDGQLRALIDYLFYRLGQLVAALLVLAAVSGLVFAVRRKRAAAS